MLSASDAEAASEVLEERDAELSAGFHQAEQDVPSLAAGLSDGSARDLAFDDDRPDVVFGPIGVERNFGAVQHPQQVGLLLAQPTQQLVERDVAANLAENATEPRPLLSSRVS